MMADAALLIARFQAPRFMLNAAPIILKAHAQQERQENTTTATHG